MPGAVARAHLASLFLEAYFSPHVGDRMWTKTPTTTQGRHGDAALLDRSTDTVLCGMGGIACSVFVRFLLVCEDPRLKYSTRLPSYLPFWLVAYFLSTT